MIRSTLAAAAVGLSAVLVAPSSASAGDVIRLGGTGVDAPVQTLGFDGDAGIDLVHRRWGWGGGWGGGWRGGWGVGWRGGWGWGAPVRWGGGWGVGWRGGWGWGTPVRWGGWGVGWGGWGGGWGTRVFVGTSFAPSAVYFAPSVYYSAFPCSTSYGAPVVTLNGTQQYYTPQYLPQQGNGGYAPAPGQVPPMPPSQDGTYPYDGGPAAPVPMPKAGDGQAPMKVTPRPGPVQPQQPGILVSYPPQEVQQAQQQQPARPATFAYPAYGEDNRATGFATSTQPRTKITTFGTGGR